jgi:hypothetical protein
MLRSSLLQTLTCFKILQDDESDWLRESARMATYMGRSACTIAALGEDGGVPCFVDRNVLARRPCKLQEGVYAHAYRARPADAAALYASHSGNYRRMNTSSSWAAIEDDASPDPLGSSPLLGRGWVFQEMLLSPRTVFFGLPGVLWRCCSISASEFRPDLSTDDFLVGNASGSTKTMFMDALGVRPKNYALYHHPEDRTGSYGNRKAWKAIVEEYFDKKLTFESDRYMAFHGITSLMQHQLGLTHVSGHWKEDLPESLLWHCGPSAFDKNVKFSLGSLSNRQRPTWSWVTAPQPLQFITENVFRDNDGETMRMHATFSIPTLEMPTSQGHLSPKLEPHELLLTLPLVQVHLYPGDAVQRFRPRLCHPRGLEREPYTSREEMIRSGCRTETDFFADVGLEPDVPLYFGLIRSEPYIYYKHNGQPWVVEHGLVISPIGGTTDTFCRVGMAGFNSRPDLTVFPRDATGQAPVTKEIRLI